MRPQRKHRIAILEVFRYSLTTTRKAPVTPNGEATAFVQRSKTCQCAVGSPQNTSKNINYASYSVYTTS